MLQEDVFYGPSDIATIGHPLRRTLLQWEFLLSVSFTFRAHLFAAKIMIPLNTEHRKTTVICLRFYYLLLLLVGRFGFLPAAILSLLEEGKSRIARHKYASLIASPAYLRQDHEILNDMLARVGVMNCASPSFNPLILYILVQTIINY